ncbi:MAG: hypothetical protein ACUVRD_07890 [Bacteroidia bacterium]
MRILWTHSPTWLLVGILVALGITWLAYRRFWVEVPIWGQWLLRALRFAGVLCLFLLLLAPMIERNIAVPQKPTLITLVDNSESITLRNPDLLKTLKNSLDSILKVLRAEGYAIRSYAFDRTLHPLDSLKGHGQGSAIAYCLNQATLRHAQEAVVATWLFTDGIETESFIPPIEETPYPVIGIVLGDTTPYPDIILKEVEAPPVLYEGEKGSFRLVYELRQLPQTVAQLYQNDKPIATLKLTQAGHTTFSWTPSQAGTYLLKIIAPPAAGEIAPANNYLSFPVFVRKKKPRLLLWAGSLTRDIAEIRRALEPSYALSFVAAKKPQGYTVALDTLDIESFDLYLFYGFPAQAIDTLWYQKALRTQKPIIHFWTGTEYPLDYRSVGVTQKPQLPLREISFRSERYATWTGKVLAPTIGLSQGSVIIGGTSENPILYHYAPGNKRYAGFVGIQWAQTALEDRLQGRTPGFEAFLPALVQWCLSATQPTFQPIRPFFYAGQPIRFTGTLAQSSYLHLDSLKIPIPCQQTDCQLTLPPMPPGKYTYKVATGMQEIEGTFEILALSAEKANLVAQPGYVAQLTRGQIYSLTDLAALADSLRHQNPPATYFSLQRNYFYLHELGLWLGIIVGIFSIEWFLRRYWGLL